MKTLILSDDNARTIVNALHAVSPSGGGSPTFALAHAIATVTGLDDRETDLDEQVGFINTVLDEMRQCMEGTPLADHLAAHLLANA